MTFVTLPLDHADEIFPGTLKRANAARQELLWTLADADEVFSGFPTITTFASIYTRVCMLCFGGSGQRPGAVVGGAGFTQDGFRAACGTSGC